MIKISVRTNAGWRQIDNDSKRRCDLCHAKLWKGPGGSTYCDAQSKKHELVESQSLGSHGLEADDFRATREDVEVHPSI